jgi:EAL domain-containing protein (putative c-di-GMP-specific phosphodiesterase class I)
VVDDGTLAAGETIPPPADPSTANAIVKLSHTLQLHTVAEGIEQAGQAAHLPTAQPAGSLSV